MELMCGCCQVHFWAGIYGTFRQLLVLDFGGDTAALVQHLTVHSKALCDDELTILNKQLVTDKTQSWILANKTVIAYEPK